MQKTSTLYEVVWGQKFQNLSPSRAISRETPAWLRIVRQIFRCTKLLHWNANDTETLAVNCGWCSGEMIGQLLAVWNSPTGDRFSSAGWKGTKVSLVCICHVMLPIFVAQTPHYLTPRSKIIVNVHPQMTARSFRMKFVAAVVLHLTTSMGWLYIRWETWFFSTHANAHKL